MQVLFICKYYRCPLYRVILYIQVSSIYRHPLYTDVIHIHISVIYKCLLYVGVRDVLYMQVLQASFILMCPWYTGVLCMQVSSICRYYRCPLLNYIQVSFKCRFYRHPYVQVFLLQVSFIYKCPLYAGLHMSFMYRCRYRGTLYIQVSFICRHPLYAGVTDVLYIQVSLYTGGLCIQISFIYRCTYIQVYWSKNSWFWDPL